MDDWFKGLGLLISLLAGLVFWRFQLIGRRRFEVAEEVLIAFSRGKDGIEYIRSPLGYMGEGQSRKKPDNEDPDTARIRDRYHVPRERHKAVEENFVGLRKTQLLCLYHFGKEAADALGVLFEARHKIFVAADMLQDMAADREDRDPETKKLYVELRREITSGGREDRMGAQIEAAQLTLERICSPYLKARSAFWPLKWPC
jgi:hypothetical protein